MALIVHTTDSIGAGLRIDLSGGDDLFVGANATIARTNATSWADFAIRATGSNHKLDIRGTVLNGGLAIDIGDTTDDTNNAITIFAGGSVSAYNPDASAIRIRSSQGRLDNRGELSSAGDCVILGSDNAGTSATLINSGVIEASESAIYRYTSSHETIVVRNSGVISGEEGSYISVGVNGRDLVTNSGTMNGDVSMAGQNDLYDGRLGTINGVVYGGDGNDQLFGGDGAETMHGEADNDTMDGGAGNDTLHGGNGNDVMRGGLGKDTVNGDAGIDTLYGGAGNEVMAGGSEADKLYGEDGNDRLAGDAGNDFLAGGKGADRMTGGEGADRFVFTSAADSTTAVAGRDMITDFNRAQGDKIDLSALDADLSLAGNQAFSLIGTRAFSGNEGELRFQTVNGDTYVYGDVNGDRVADFAIALAPALNLQASDFVL